MKKRNVILVLILINLVVSTTSPIFTYGLRFPLLGMTVKGTIYKSGTTTTISNAKISLIVAGVVNGITYSDTSGAYSISYKGDLLTNPISGQLKVEKSGYYTKTVNTIIPAIGQPPTIENVYLTLIPVIYNYAVTAVVSNFDGYRIANAVVTLSGYDKSDQAVTNAYGVCGVGITLSTGGARTFTLTASHQPNQVEYYQDYSTTVTVSSNIPTTKDITMIEGVCNDDGLFAFGYFNNPIENSDFNLWNGADLNVGDDPENPTWIINGGYEKTSGDNCIEIFGLKSTGAYDDYYFEMTQQITDPNRYRHYLGRNVIFSFNILGHVDSTDMAKAGIRYSINGVWSTTDWGLWVVAEKPEEAESPTWNKVFTEAYIPSIVDGIEVTICGFNNDLSDKFDTCIDDCNFGISYHQSAIFSSNLGMLMMIYGFEIYSINDATTIYDEVLLATTLETRFYGPNLDDTPRIDSNMIRIDAPENREITEVIVNSPELDHCQVNDMGFGVIPGEDDFVKNHVIDIVLAVVFTLLGIVTAGCTVLAGAIIAVDLIWVGVQTGFGIEISTLRNMKESTANPLAKCHWAPQDGCMGWQLCTAEVQMLFEKDAEATEVSEIEFKYEFKTHIYDEDIGRTDIAFSSIFMSYFAATKSWGLSFYSYQ